MPATNPSTGTDNASIKRRILVGWALIPPKYHALKPLPELLGTVETVLPEHDYFKKWKPLALEALVGGEYAVIKRG